MSQTIPQQPESPRNEKIEDARILSLSATAILNICCLYMRGGAYQPPCHLPTKRCRCRCGLLRSRANLANSEATGDDDDDGDDDDARNGRASCFGEPVHLRAVEVWTADSEGGRSTSRVLRNTPPHLACGSCPHCNPPNSPRVPISSVASHLRLEQPHLRTRANATTKLKRSIVRVRKDVYVRPARNFDYATRGVQVQSSPGLEYCGRCSFIGTKPKSGETRRLKFSC